MTELKTQLEQLGQQLSGSDESRQQLMQQLQQEQQRCVDVQDQAQVMSSCFIMRLSAG